MIFFGFLTLEEASVGGRELYCLSMKRKVDPHLNIVDFSMNTHISNTSNFLSFLY